MKEVNINVEPIARQALDELRELSADGIFRISMIEWWLLKYESSYEVGRDDWKCKLHLEDVDATCICGVKPVGHVFVELYRILEDVCALRRLESRFSQEIEHYNSVKNNHGALREWEIGLEDWAGKNCSLIQYKGINYFDNKPLLIVYQYHPSDFKIAIRKSELPFAIRFHQIWEQVYWGNNFHK